MNYALVGFGRMGRAIDRVARGRGHVRRAVVDPMARSRGVHRALSARALRDVEVAFEFTEPAAAANNLELLLEAGVCVVCGTTGWKPGRDLRARAKASQKAVVLAPNFSVGMNLFARIVRHAARSVGAAGLHWPYVFEVHHTAKLDAPSGTAKWLAEGVASADPRHPTALFGDLGGRLPDGAMHVVGLRAGHETGTHVVGFDGEHDVLELRHRARSRDGFALGAVLAGEWVENRIGVFSFDRVLDDMLGAKRRKDS